MKLSTKGRYAITAMMELALRHKQGPVTLADISVEQSISVSYLEQLFAQLRKQGLVTACVAPVVVIVCVVRPVKSVLPISCAPWMKAWNPSLSRATSHRSPSHPAAKACCYGISSAIRSMTTSTASVLRRQSL